MAQGQMLIRPELRDLDELVLTYPGWREDYQKAEVAHTGQGRSFESCIHTLNEKQRMYCGDRSHPRLVALDALVLTYPGHETDVKRAEDLHVRQRHAWGYDDLLDGLENKQRLHDRDYSHPEIRELKSLFLTYPDWREDYKAAIRAHTGSGRSFKTCIYRLKEQERMHRGDRSHPRLQALDALMLTYPGYEKDLKRAEDHHLRYLHAWGYDDLLEGLIKKQRLHEERLQNSREIEQEGRKDGPDLGMCVICLENGKAHVFIPCGHVSTCGACAVETMKRSRHCPICRVHATQSVRLYFS